MNELEREIEEKAIHWVFEENGYKWSNNDDSAGDNTQSFKAGANFILEKNLIEKFTIWKDQDVQYHSPTLEDPTYFYYLVKDNKVEFFTIQDIIDYWLNNVYGK